MAEWLRTPRAHPHDAFFKWVFSEERWAMPFLAQFLPPQLSAAANWSTLRLEAASGSDHALLAPISMDLLFSVEWKRARNVPAGRKSKSQRMRPSVLFEHQSKDELGQSFRLLRYILLTMRRSQRKRGFPLPAVIPLVLHQGSKPWTAPRKFSELLDIPAEHQEALRPYLVDFEYHVVDLADPTIQASEGTELSLIFEAMRAVSRDRVRELFHWIAENLQPGWDEELVAASLGYGLRSSETLDEREALDILRQNRKLRPMITTADRICTMMREEGIREGEACGEAHGRLYGQIQLLERLVGDAETRHAVLAGMAEEQLLLRIKELEVRLSRTGLEGSSTTPRRGGEKRKRQTGAV
jgi:predicted transposase/invertase (TIGR01784 family)